MKGEPLRHDFGSGEVAAYRWINADGIQGGIVAESARVDDTAVIGAGATIGEEAVIGYMSVIGDTAIINEGASIGDGASIEGEDWYITGGPCGSRKAMWTAVHSHEYGLRWWVGCQYGISTEALLERVQETHGDNEHAQAYRHAVQCVTTHPEYLKRTQEGQSE